MCYVRSVTARLLMRSGMACRGDRPDSTSDRLFGRPGSIGDHVIHVQLYIIYRCKMHQ